MKERLIYVDAFRELPRKRSREAECYSAIVACIILQALKDYAGRNWCGSQEDIEWRRIDAKRFLESDYCEFLCMDGHINGRLLMDYVDRHGLPQVSTEAIVGISRGHGKEGNQNAAKRKGLMPQNR